MNIFKRIISFFHKNEQAIYFILLLCIAFTFSFSRYFLRMWIIVMVVLFILNGRFPAKIRRLKQNYPLLILASFFFLFLLGSFYAVESNEGFKQLRVLLPWLGLPIVIGSYPGLSSYRFYLFLQVFILGVFLHTIISYLASIGLPLGEVNTFRDLGLYYSIHRFVLTIVLAIFSLFYYLKIHIYHLNKLKLAGYFIALFWLVFFLFYTKNLTGILGFVLISVIYIFYFALHQKNIFLRTASLIIFLSITVFFGGKFYEVYADFWKVPEISEMQLPEKTSNGNDYTHDTTSTRIINGHYLNLFLCEKEIKVAWDKRSELGYNEKTDKSTKVRNVLKRYLTSKGLRKDSAGVSKLHETDIKAIEDGIINYKFAIFDFTDRLYMSARELHHYQENSQPNGTLTARLFAIKEGMKIFKQKPLIGHGTNSSNIIYNDFYSKFEERDRYYVTAHNQYVQFLIEFGIIGFLWFLASIFYPYFVVKGYKFFMFNTMFAYFLIASFMNNPFSSQLALTIWVTFYSVFYVYFGYQNQGKEAIK